MLDVDALSLLNDRYGLSECDQILKEVAGRIGDLLADAGTLTRFGGDEFTILLERVGAPDVVRQVAEKIHQQLARPFVFMNREMYVSTSIGIALYPEHGDDIGTLLKSADMAMYRAKKQGQSYQFYQSTMEVEVRPQLVHRISNG